MKKLILLLLCISIEYACKKKTIEPEPPAKIVNTCDSIYCLQAVANAKYEFQAQGGGDTIMTNHSFRMVYTYKDSVFNGSNNEWDVYLHYELRNATFNTNIINPQYLTFKHKMYSGNNGIGLITKGGNFAFFKKTILYH